MTWHQYWEKKITATFLLPVFLQAVYGTRCADMFPQDLLKGLTACFPTQTQGSFIYAHSGVTRTQHVALSGFDCGILLLFFM